MKNDTLTGILAALGISISAAIAVPLVNVFTTIQPSELMMVRGLVTLSIVVLFWSKKITRPDKKVLAFSTLFGLANLMLYMGIREWGANPIIVILTTTPLVNIVAKRWRGKHVNTRVYMALGGLMLGVSIALNPWETEFNLLGCIYGVLATLLAGIGFEVLSTTKQLDSYDRTFWLAVVILGIGLAATLAQGAIPFTNESLNLIMILKLTGFGFIAGFIYFMANIIAFDKLKTETASTLAMGETPAVIVSAGLILGEELSIIQWLGVLIALGATLALSGAEAKASQDEAEAI